MTKGFQYSILASGSSGNCFYLETNQKRLLVDAGLSGKHHWLAFGKRLKGSITIDDGCARAVLDKGASILPAGIVDVEGTFGPGDTISIYHNGKEIGRGLINYSVDDMKAIKGHNTNDIAQLLGINTTYDEAIHRNNLVLLH